MSSPNEVVALLDQRYWFRRDRSARYQLVVPPLAQFVIADTERPTAPFMELLKQRYVERMKAELSPHSDNYIRAATLQFRASRETCSCCAPLTMRDCHQMHCSRTPGRCGDDYRWVNDRRKQSGGNRQRRRRRGRSRRPS